MKRRVVSLVACFLMIGALPGTARAQSGNPPLSELLPSLFLDSGVDGATALITVFPGANVDSIIDQFIGRFNLSGQINDLLGNQLSSFPLGSSAGGFTWTFDPTMGTYSRASNTFGPTFAERALTIGRNRFNLGVNFQRATFDQVEGKDLRGEDIKLYTGVNNVFFEDGLDLKVTTNTLGIFANYGVTDRLDVGVAIPIVTVDLEARLVSRVGNSFTGVSPTAREFVYEESGDASGIGDVVVRAKYNFWRMTGGGLAAGLDLRLPTGDELDLLGVAGTQAKMYVAASTAYNRLSPHVNLGFTVSGASKAANDPDTSVFPPPDEINFAGGTDFALSSRATISADVISRTLRDIGRLEEVVTEFGQNFREFNFRSGNLNMLLGAVGAKFNPWPNLLVSGNVLFPLNDNGLTDKLTWVLGFDYSF